PRCRTDYPSGTYRCTNPHCKCLLPEAIVAGRYRIETLLGIGGMGAVYRASDMFEMQQVALKIISAVTSNADTVIAIERFRREARYAHQLHHKNIVPVLNFGQDGTLLYLVMPLITGGTLKGMLKAEQPLPLALAKRYINELADAIDTIHAHPQNIVHRDIKPSNLLIHQDDGHLVVTDFGIARAMQKERPLTQEGWSLGTEHYTAPEQGQGKAKPASDIYSMGVIAYQMLTGILPFQAIVRNRGAQLPKPSELNPLVPQAADAIILRAMEPDPRKRYRSARAFAEALNEAFKSVAQPAMPTQFATNNNANVIVQTIIPENPCSECGQENRISSHFCRRCGHKLDDTSPLVTEVCQVGYVSDTGRRYVAEDNEDMLLIVQGLCANLPPPPRPFGLLVVADGKRSPEGKSVTGHEASRLAIETVADVLLPFLATPLPSSSYTTPNANSPASRINKQVIIPQSSLPPEKVFEQWMGESIRRANQVIYHCNADYDTHMASTLTIALVHKRHLYVSSVGDSRVYHFSSQDNVLQCISTRQPSYSNSLKAQQIDLIDTSPIGLVSHCYLGQETPIAIDYFHTQAKLNDLVLLCTNGLWHMLSDEHIKEILAQGGDPQKLARVLVDEANLAGGEGNVSVIVVGIQ
ncbi:MAG TPA: protein kinase, partial [Ktedonobacteraceae bacterium]|nr:protein kinase [Ktedonobacteraceae bacterium]